MPPPSSGPRPTPSLPPTAAAAVPRRLPPLLRQAWYGLNQTFRQRIAHLEITPDQFSILRWLSEGDPKGLTQRELSDLMSSDPNTITSTLSRMEAAELISRQPHELDRRAHRVRLKPAGIKVLGKAQQFAVDLQTQLLGALPAGRRDKFLDELATLAAACTAELRKPSRTP